MTTRVRPALTLEPLAPADRETFIAENQRAFNYGALVEFGERNTIFEEEGQIISRATIERSINEGQAYRILAGGRPVGGLVVQVEGSRGTLDLLFIAPEEHSKGYGQAAWALVEEAYPAVTTWETFTPYFETRNVHFYVNKLGFEIVEFFNLQHPNPHYPASQHGAGGSSAAHEDFLFMKTLAKKPVQAGVQRVRYADRGQLHQLINLQGLKACRYGQDADGSGWLELR